MRPTEFDTKIYQRYYKKEVQLALTYEHSYKT